MKRLNKKGFTLVELLAVIVILALIMAIAIYSISGVLQNSRASVFRDTAASIIRGVKLQLTANNKLESGRYYFTRTMLESGGTNPPFGGNYIFYDTNPLPTGTTKPTVSDDSPIAAGVYKASKTATLEECSDHAVSYVDVALNSDGSSSFSICLTTGSSNRYIDGSEADVLGGKDGVIKPDNGTTTSTSSQS